MEEKFTSILEKIKSEEYALRDIKVTETSHGNELTGKDIFNSQKFAPVISFIILCRYSNMLNFEVINDKVDITNQLMTSQHEYSIHVCKLWNEIKDSYPYINQLVRIINCYDLNQFHSNKSDKILANFLTDNYLFQDLDNYWVTNSLMHDTCFEIIWDSRKILGLELRENGKYFISVENGLILRTFVKEFVPGQKFVFSTSKYFSLDIKLLSLFLPSFSDWDLVEIFDKDSADNIPDDMYDGLIYMRMWNKEADNLNVLLTHIKQEGFCIAFNQSAKRSYAYSKIFSYKIPLILDILESLIIVCINTKDITEDVRCGSFYINEGYNESEYWKDKFIRQIKMGGNDIHFQILKKDDLRFAINGKINFSSIKRKLDQMNFVWRKLSDVVSQPETELIIDASNIDITPIIGFDDLSNNPFKIKAKSSIYSHPLHSRSSDSNPVVDEFELKQNIDIGKNSTYSYKLPQKYEQIFENTFNWNGNNNDKEKEFNKFLTCRIVNTPALIYESGRILRVNASNEFPVCIKKLTFFFSDDFGYYECQGQADVISISPEYDENFIIYQLLNGNTTLSNYILVAPTKEEQRTYFLNKRIEYISSIQPAMDEMEDEIQKALSQSSSRITGIGFRNFRRFIALNMLQLGGINILVGGNNAGKSTLVKGLLLILDNLQSFNTQNIKLLGNQGMFNFQLDANNIHDVHIGTFNRALSYSAHKTKSDSHIVYTVQIANFIVETTISSYKNDDLSTVPIHKIKLIDIKRNITFIFDYYQKITTINSNSNSSQFNYICKDIPHNIFRYKINVISAQIRAIADYISSDDNGHQEFDQLKILSAKVGFMIEIADELNGILSNIQIEYIYAHGIQQKILFNYNDKNDYMAMTLHDLMNEHITNDEHIFICDTMKSFGIGQDYDISSIGGEAYTIQIKNQSGMMVHLADMGMGASQLLILIFKLATIIHRQRMRGVTPYRPTIIIEEPEQNMHPEYQSKLADLFYEMHNKYGFNFIVETHSEYLVRKTQVLVAKEHYSEQELNLKNPFKVFYFPTDDNPYEMEYRNDGNFTNEFGEGFYDEASNLLFSIL